MKPRATRLNPLGALVYLGIVVGVGLLFESWRAAGAVMVAMSLVVGVLSFLDTGRAGG